MNMKIAIFFPGIGYHCDKPLLYYARDIVDEMCYEKVVSLSYSYDGGNIRGNKEKMREAFESLYLQADKFLADIDFTEYDEIVLISKSVGTIIASAYAQKHSLKCKHILLTPLEETFTSPHEQGIVFIGTSDPWSNVDKVIKFANEQGVRIEVYEGLNHSLEGDDAIRNIEVLQDVINKIKGWLEK